MNYTTFEQSKKLFELGLKRETADMVWSSVCYEGSPKNGDENLWNCYLDPKTNHFYYAELVEAYSYDSDDAKEYPSIPCWTIGALLRLMNGIVIATPNPLCNKYHCYGVDNKFTETFGETPTEACFNMMVWLLENDVHEKGNMKTVLYDEDLLKRKVI